MSEHIRILSENPLEQVWLHLSRLESITLARRAVDARAKRTGVNVTPDMLDKKAVGVAYSLRSARDYLSNTADSPTKRILSSYYGMMSFLSAVLIADPASKYDLHELELATKAGHGLGAIDDDASTFPVAQKVYVNNNGFLHRYLKHAGVDPTEVKIAKRFERVTDLDDVDRARLVSLDELVARVPELADFYFEVTDRPPLSAQVFAARRTFNDVRHQGFGPFEPAKLQWVGVRAPGIGMDSADMITLHLGMPLADVQIETDEPTKRQHWIGSVNIPEGRKYWHEALSLYKSPMCPTSWCRPLLGKITDPLVLHFVTLYLLSIIVRYRPKLWREIGEGSFTDYFALLRSYLAVVDRVIPELILARILDREIRCVQPGSFNAPM